MHNKQSAVRQEFGKSQCMFDSQSSSSRRKHATLAFHASDACGKFGTAWAVRIWSTAISAKVTLRAG